MKNTTDCYFELLEKTVFETSSQMLEANLSAAFELGRKQQELNVPPDEIIVLHHEAVSKLSLKYPQLKLTDVSDKLTLPLMEMSMAYGLMFRQQMEQRYENILNNRLQHSAKLEAIGTLAAGLAHDFNNILGSIVGYAEMAGDEVKERPLAQHCIEQLLIASFRARDLVSRMLAFARQSPVLQQKINVVKEVKESIMLLKSSLPLSINIHFSTVKEDVFVLADATQIQQIIMNLCINSADAMPDGGDIQIRVQSIRNPESDRTVEQPSSSVEDICLTVSDNGSGMTEEVKTRAFDPFFTTKAPNKGSGLGLSVVYGIVTGLGGKVELHSNTNGSHKGTHFTIFLPATTLIS